MTMRRRQLALHDDAAVRMRFDADAVRRHQRVDRLTQPEHGFGSEICAARLKSARIICDARAIGV